MGGGGEWAPLIRSARNIAPACSKPCVTCLAGDSGRQWSTVNGAIFTQSKIEATTGQPLRNWGSRKATTERCWLPTATPRPSFPATAPSFDPGRTAYASFRPPSPPLSPSSLFSE
eukprot:353652-Chlamydomonas_euryale.AAC.3